MAADEIDYQIIGDDLQAVIITLDPGEAVFAEAGGMMFMREGITMATTLDPNAKGGGLFDKLVGAGKRVLALGIPGRTYQLQVTPDLGVWTPLGAPVVCPAAGAISLLDPGPLPSTRFYRLLETAP